MGLPEHTRRLFPDATEADLLAAAGRGQLIARLLEDGDEEDLRWLAQTVGEAALAAWFARWGGRRLSRRSRAFWRTVLGVEPRPPAALAEALWPL